MNKCILPLLLLTLVQQSFAETTGIKHVVLCWMAEEHSTADVDAVIEGFHQLAKISVVDELVVGGALSSTRDIVDDSFDVGAVMHFKNAENLESFMVDAEHKRLTHEVLAPRCPRALVYDISY